MGKSEFTTFLKITGCRDLIAIAFELLLGLFSLGCIYLLSINKSAKEETKVIGVDLSGSSTKFKLSIDYFFF